MSATVAAASRTIHLPMPHPGQQTVLRQAKRFCWLCAGRRWRKTTLGLQVIVPAMLKPRKECGWFAPTYKQVRVGWDELRHAAGNVFEFNESRMEVRSPTGARTRFASLDDPDTVRGWTLDQLVMDEASEIAERAWYEVLRPMLMDTGGGAWFMYTPKGMNWTWREWVAAAERADSSAWQIPALGAVVVDGDLHRQPHALENPHIPWSELEQMWHEMPHEKFRQEILAEFLQDGGAAFQNVDAVLTSQPKQRPFNGAESYILGVDLAKSQDYTVVSVFSVQERRQVGLERWNRCDWGLTKARIITLAQIWNNAVVYLDATGLGDPIYDDLARARVKVVGYKITAATRTPLLENLILLIEQGRIALLNQPIQTAELKAMQPHRDPSGLIRYRTPEPLHDDIVFANALACLPLANDHRGLPQAAIDMLRVPVSAVGGGQIMGKVF